MLSTSPHAKARLLTVALLAALGLGLAGTTHDAKAASLADIFAACNNYGDTPVAKLSPAATDLTLLCLIDKERHKAGRSYLAINFPLGRAAAKHAKESIASPFWDKSRGHVSHLDPGTPIPPDEPTLQAVGSQQAVARVAAQGFCPGGSSWQSGEITYGGVGSGSTPRAAVKWWMGDPEHHDALLDPKWRLIGPVGYKGSAFNPPDTGLTGTFVVEFGVCNK